jgi:hypothetical protein
MTPASPRHLLRPPSLLCRWLRNASACAGTANVCVTALGWRVGWRKQGDGTGSRQVGSCPPGHCYPWPARRRAFPDGPRWPREQRAASRRAWLSVCTPSRPGRRSAQQLAARQLPAAGRALHTPGSQRVDARTCTTKWRATTMLPPQTKGSRRCQGAFAALSLSARLRARGVQGHERQRHLKREQCVERLSTRLARLMPLARAELAHVRWCDRSHDARRFAQLCPHVGCATAYALRTLVATQPCMDQYTNYITSLTARLQNRTHYGFRCSCCR